MFSEDGKESHSISVLIILDEEDTIREFKIQRPNSKEDVAKKWICVLSFFIAIISTHLPCQM